MNFKYLGKKPPLEGSEAYYIENHYRGALKEAAQAIENQRTSEDNTFMKADTFMFKLRKLLLVSAGENDE